jgi:Phage integrase family
MRHTALTRLAESGCDAFTLARVAGHSSITITQRYCHPQADAIERAFVKLTAGSVRVVNTFMRAGTDGQDINHQSSWSLGVTDKRE